MLERIFEKVKVIDFFALDKAIAFADALSLFTINASPTVSISTAKTVPAAKTKSNNKNILNLIT